MFTTWSTRCEFVSDKFDTVEWSSSVAAANCAMASAVFCCMLLLTLLAVYPVSGALACSSWRYWCASVKCVQKFAHVLSAGGRHNHSLHASLCTAVRKIR
eukprot:8871228-Ditylum_brightwellii.AAC.1